MDVKDNSIRDCHSVVTDYKTHLQWQNDGQAPDALWEEAITYCEELELGCQTDWRLPNVYELYSLTDPSQTNPALSPDHPFLGMDSGSYWSSTTAYYTEIKNAAGYVEFAIARLYYYVKSADKLVWPVRAGKNSGY